ncbi:hypothetical protein BC826DRAFT_973146 [Russula brevipes]|nr:hypothetical protein BC826DRAFT_973146 [Russula brevipes]
MLPGQAHIAQATSTPSGRDWISAFAQVASATPSRESYEPSTVQGPGTSGRKPEEVTLQGDVGEGTSALIHEPEQEYIPAPVSYDPSFEGTGYIICLDKGKGRARDTSPQYADSSPTREGSRATLDKLSARWSAQIAHVRQEANTELDGIRLTLVHADQRLETLGARVETMGARMESIRARMEDVVAVTQALTLRISTRDTDILPAPRLDKPCTRNAGRRRDRKISQVAKEPRHDPKGNVKHCTRIVDPLRNR